MILIILYTLYGNSLANLSSNEFKVRDKEYHTLQTSNKRFVVYWLGKDSLDRELQLRCNLLVRNDWLIRSPISYLNAFMACTSSKACTAEEAIKYIDCKQEYEIVKIAVRLKLSDALNIPWAEYISPWSTYHINMIMYINSWRRQWCLTKLDSIFKDFDFYLPTKLFYPQETEIVP